MPEDLRKLNDEIKELEKEYKDSVDAFKNFFSPDSNYQGGKFNSHNIALNWQGTRIEKDNVGFMALRDNAYIFSSIVMLLSGFLGIRAIVGGF
ncbi:MAG: hypothetical protein JKY55_05980 [Aliivibrio sp.]|uniref:hypothetical protein n=1 Tax=Aliivibrio sp. TaxID=1872443 RepID=UPI001A5EC1CB|nr:hypothetical protein [Aliivibrio sp.]